MQSMIVNLMYVPVNGWMAICGHQSRSMGIVGMSSNG
jgi:hypothetical protein